MPCSQGVLLPTTKLSLVSLTLGPIGIFLPKSRETEVALTLSKNTTESHNLASSLDLQLIDVYFTTCRVYKQALPPGHETKLYSILLMLRKEANKRRLLIVRYMVLSISISVIPLLHAEVLACSIHHSRLGIWCFRYF